MFFAVISVMTSLLRSRRSNLSIKNFHCLVPAVAGTTVELFPEDPERYEYAEFVSCITDENGQNIGMKCRIKPSPKIMQFFGNLENLVWEVDLICGKEVYAEDNNYENGKNTHTYRRLLLQVKDRTQGMAPCVKSEETGTVK